MKCFVKRQLSGGGKLPFLLPMHSDLRMPTTSHNKEWQGRGRGGGKGDFGPKHLFKKQVFLLTLFTLSFAKQKLDHLFLPGL